MGPVKHHRSGEQYHVPAFGGTADALAYTYDNAGNIATISENGVLKASYRYDQFGQLVREDNAWAGKTYIYVYDAGGNLTQCREAAYTTGGIAAYTGGSTYSYATGTEEDGVTPVWKDLLTSYNGNTITYDAIGNPLNLSASITNMTWNNGRRLTSLKNGASVIQYGYDESGLRTRKYTGTYTVYDRDASGNLVHETRNNGTNHLYYYYDANGVYQLHQLQWDAVRLPEEPPGGCHRHPGYQWQCGGEVYL